MLSQSAILKKLRAEQEENIEGGWTREEFQDSVGVQQSRAKVMIRDGIKNGTIVMNGYGRRVRIDGRLQRLPTYLFTDAIKTTSKTDHRAKAGAASGVRTVPHRRNG
jgi:hypothetical protein